MILTKSQSDTVNKLFNIYVDVLNNKNHNKIVNFKAPTGSGKTFISSELISRIFEYNSTYLYNAKTVIIVATVSNAELPKQFTKKLNSYKKYHLYNKYDIEYISSPSSSNSAKSSENDVYFKLDNNVKEKVFVFGTSSFGKKKVFTDRGILDNFLTDIKNKGYKLIYIRDEAHIGGKTDADKSVRFDEKMTNNSDFVIKMTATVKDYSNLVELKVGDLNSDGQYLLKSPPITPKFYKESIDNDDEIIDKAIEDFQKIKKDYANLNDCFIRPAMLVQVDNDSKKNKEKHNSFLKGMELLESKFKKAGLVYLKYLDGEPYISSQVGENTLSYASKNDSLIDVIIFKVGPATGWDIPRACMLLQLRSVSSENLNIQTIGRIMRNPYPNLEQNDVCKKCYLYSSYQLPSREIISYKIKDKFIDEKLYVGEIDRNFKDHETNRNNYQKDVIKWLKSNEFKSIIDDFDINNDIVYTHEKLGDTDRIYKIPNYVSLLIYNYKKWREYNENKSGLIISSFDTVIMKLAKSYKYDLEILKYIFLKNISHIKDLFAKHWKWVKNRDAYIIKKDGLIKPHYYLWKDSKKEPKFFNFKEIENYGYVQITNDNSEKYIQYLDSGPELEFYKKLKEELFNKNSKNPEIRFFAKMPTLGSQIYFEYYSNVTQTIAKSYMDYALVIDNKTYMIEVKSADEDYNPEKTTELDIGYEKYMQKLDMLGDEKLILILYQYNKKTASHYFNYWDSDRKKWCRGHSAKETFNKLFF